MDTHNGELIPVENFLKTFSLIVWSVRYFYIAKFLYRNPPKKPKNQGQIIKLHYILRFISVPM